MLAAAESRFLPNQENSKDSLANDIEWLQGLPVKELTRQGYLTPGADPEALLQQVCRFFGVANHRSWERVWREPSHRFESRRASKPTPASRR
jgi:hypothetical protein